MKLTVKTLKGSHFEIRVQPSDTIMAVKKNIEDLQGKDNYPCGQQLLIHNGKVLKDESTLVENKISGDGFLVVMLSKSKASSSSGTGSAQAASVAAPSSIPEPTPQPAAQPAPQPAAQPAPQPAAQPAPQPAEQPAPQPAAQPAPPAPPVVLPPLNVYGEVAANVVSQSNLEPTVQQLMDMGGGMWDKETVTRALRAAYNNPERAVDYLYSGIPETAEVAVPLVQVGTNSTTQTGAAPVVAASGAPNSSPLNLFPQEIPSAEAAAGAGAGSLDFLRSNQQFQALRSMVQANPQILQPMLQELGKQNPQLLRLIEEHNQEFLQLISEPVDGSEGDMPHAVSVTPAEQEIIERLEAMGFDRAIVIEAFLACDRNEELAINYLLENAGDYED